MSHAQVIRELLRQFPRGFSVSASGHFSEIVAATSHFSALARLAVDLPAEGGGFLAIRPTTVYVDPTAPTGSPYKKAQEADP